jgi:lysophospholipase L1-like esterase
MISKRASQMQKQLLLVSTLSILLLGCVNGSTSSTSNTAINNATNNTTTKIEPAITANTFTGINSRLIGRFDQSTPGQAKFTWPGSAIEFRFAGSNASINIASPNPVRFLVNVNGKTQNLWTQAGTHNYALASNLVKGTHEVRLTRANESTAGVTSFTSDPLVDGNLLAVQAPQKRLLVIGDSITAGYGVEGADQNCHYTLDTSNQQLTYAALAANSLGADLHAIAWSGIGAWRSYGEKTPVNQTILDRYPRTLADDSTSSWNPTQYTPDAILINIGTNDYWEGSASDNYRTALIKLITRVQNDYTGKPIYLIVSPMLSNNVREAQKQVFNTLVKDKVKVVDLGESNGAEGFGCDYHPNSTTQVRLGKALENKLKAELNW